jgi:peptidoglycan/LPS O-acetylase OafA/YrhL
LKLKLNTPLKEGVSFRQDLVGLRGLAILSVLLFHYFPFHRLTSGGFIGVDIFFVLSGFVITKSILSKPFFGKREFLSFIAKRIKRLFPALISILLFLLTWGFLLYRENEYQSLLNEIKTTSVFLSNWSHVKKASYFDPSIYSDSLLHTWSLAIEGQFYFALPIIILCIRKKNIQLIILSVIFFISFSSLVFFSLSQNMKFYGTSTRVWELLAGVIAAYAQYFYSPSLGRLSLRPLLQRFYNASPVLGISLIATGLLLIDSSSDFPGLLTLFPVCGTLLIILSNTKSIVSRYFFNNRLLLFFGEISYSLYLWHWILLSSVFILLGHIPGLYLKIFLILLAIMISSISTFFLEKPIIAMAKNTRITWIMIFCLLPIFLFSSQVSSSTNIDARKAARIQQNYSGDVSHKKFYTYLENSFSHCSPTSLYNSASKYSGYSRCYQGNEGIRDVALIGDSHTEHIFPGLSSKFPDLNFVYYLTNSDYSVENLENYRVSKVILEDPNIKFVVINSFWFANRINTNNLTKFIDLFTNAGKKVLVFNDVPDFNFDPMSCKFTRPYLNFKICSQKLPNDYFFKISLLKSVVDNREGSYFIDTFGSFCNLKRKSCSMINNEQILYRDYHHLNLEGSLFFASMINDKAVFTSD